uniref:Uncharacterized protein n=1 Tax=Tetraselmis sp. GSL018 TaxID=582737 RepID=A0A061RHQ4_9CHLO
MSDICNCPKQKCFSWEGRDIYN